MATYNQNAMTLPNGDVVNFEDAYGRVEYIRGTWASATNVWTGVTTDPVLYDGKKIVLFFPYGGNSSNATLNLTLSGGGTTGAKNVYFNSTTRCTTHYGQYAHVEFVYHSSMQIGSSTYEGWWSLPGRDTTINYQMRHYNNIYCKTAAAAYQMVCGTDTGYIPAVANAVFDVSYPLLTTQAAWTAGSNYGNGFFEYQDQNIRNAFPALGSSYAGLTAKKMVYLVGSSFIGVSFTIDSTLVTCTPNAEGKFYIPIGIAYSTYQYYFYSQRVVYTYSNGTLSPVGSGGGGGATGFGGVEMHGVELLSSGWSNGSQTVSISTAAIASSDFLSIPQVETAADYTGAGIVLSTVNVDASLHTASLTFTCTATPISNVSTTVIVSTSAMETEIDLAAAIANYPKIQNGKWYTWNMTTEQWVDSGVKAGISSITQTTTSTADEGINVVTATLSDGTTSTFNIRNGSRGSQGPKGDDGDSAVFYFLNKTVAVADWASDNTYSDYPYKATVTCTGVTANDGALVTFSLEDSESLIFAPICNTVTNGVEIWAKEAKAITIPTIAIFPPISGSIETPSASWLDQVYPVGSVYMNSTNTNPSSILGGTWTLIDKYFSNLTIGSDNYTTYFTAGSGITIAYMGAYRSEHAIEVVRLTYTSTSVMSDDQVTVGTFDFTALGCPSGPAYATFFTSHSDGGNGFVMTQVSTGGVLSNTDVVTKTSGGTIAAGSTIAVNNLRIVLPITRIADSACDRFYWKRTA